ncbi:hypothetical protein [Methylobacterium variabile]|jgi:hypothetical protein|uniref:hypothetical protein n=1 Tax=Methylobacterium variabile TaxID=298794 RepID=UPI00069F7A5B|nr:hypothetical protein [Methylobacterium variabile]
MSTRITLDHVLVDTGSADCEGCLAYRDGRLIGVLTQLDPDLHGDLGVGRHWFLEAGFGPVAAEPRPPTFLTLDEACAWLDGRTAGAGPRCPASDQPVTPRCAAAGHSPSAGWCETGHAPRR